MSTPRRGVVVRGTLFGALVLVCAGCTTMSPGPRWEGRVESVGITVEVENRVWNDVVIYSAVHGSRTRLGTVTTGMTSRFRIPRHQLNATSWRFIADPIGSRFELRSDQIHAGPGQTIRWIVHENAGISSLIIR